MRYTYLICGLISLTVIGCGGTENKSSSASTSEGTVDDLRETARLNFLPLEENSSTKASDDKIVLGKRIFFEKGLSLDNSTSCNSCHNIDNFGVDNLALSKGAEGGFTARNTPTIFNTHMHAFQFWDGRAKTLREQIRMPIMTEGEMAMADEESIVRALNSVSGYKEEFKKVYPASSGIEVDDMSDAVATYIESLVYPSKFDKYLSDNSFELSSSELSGLELFMDKGCTDCHQGRLLGGDSFEKFGVHDIYWKYTRGVKIDSGKFLVTRDPEDLFVFKVPSLRNVDKTQPYFHDGSIDDLVRAIQVMGKVQLNEEINKEDAKSIAVFLETLTGQAPKMTASLK